MRCFKGGQSWWGGRLACLADSLATYVIRVFIFMCGGACNKLAPVHLDIDHLTGLHPYAALAAERPRCRSPTKKSPQ
jgi:hypothetical protein